jgi:parallel beta-helix repeat protein
LVTLTIIFGISTGQSSAAIIDVGPTNTYTTINSGIAAASANDTIIVHHNPNNYTEQVVVNKQGLKINASPGEDVTVQTTGSSTGFSINNVNNVTIGGFRIQGNNHTQGTGISLSNSNYCTIMNNVINSYLKGVSITGSNNNITNNIINDTTMGVGLTYPSNNNTISNNNITNPTYNQNTEVRLGLREDGSYFGIWTPNQYNNYLNNNISNVNEGIFIQQGTNFNISNNKITIKDTYNYPWAITLSVGNTANQVDIISKNSISSEGNTNGGSRGVYLISNPSSPTNANMQIYSNNIANFGDGIYSILYTPTGTSVTQLYLNRFYNNTHGLTISGSTQFTAINNWWGKNTTPTVYISSPPATFDIFDDLGTVTYDPWIVLNINANPGSILTGSSSNITADLTKNSNNQDTSILYPGQYLLNGIPVNFSSDSLGNVNPAANTTTNGKTTTSFTANNVPGTSAVSATVDGQTVSTGVTINGLLIPTGIIVNPVSGFNGNTVTLTATLTDLLNNIKVQGKTIQFSVNGISAGTAVTDVNGVATLPYIITQNFGTYIIQAAFLQDTSYLGSNSTNNLNVLDITPPVVTSTDPANNAVNVAVNKVILVNFSEAIKFSNSPWIELKNYTTGTAISFIPNISGNVLSITPNTILSYGTIIQLILHSNSVTDMAGNGLATPYLTKFNTTSPPILSSTDPANNAVNVALNKVIKFNFNKTIKLGTNPWIELKNLSTGKAATFTTTVSGSTLSITPTTLMSTGNVYQVILHSNSVTDLTGTAGIAPISIKFTTTTPPTVSSTDPVNNAVNVPLNKVIKFNFNKTIKLGTNPWIELKNLTTGKAATFTTTVSGSTLSITPKTLMSKGNVYQVILHSNSVTDSTSTAGIAPISIKFTTTKV